MMGRHGPAMLYSAKTCAAALLALWISLMVGLPMPFWAMSTAYIVSNPLSGATRSKAIYRVMGTAIGAGAAVAMVPLLVDWPVLLCLAMAVWIGGCLAVSLLDRSPRSYVLMLAGYTTAIIAFPSVDVPETVFDTAVARVTEITLGITCATLSHSLLWPRSVASALSPRLHRWLADAERWLGAETAERGLTAADPAQTARDRRQLAVDAVECALLATHVPYDTSHWREANQTVRGLLDRMLLLLPLLSGLADRRGAMAPGDHAAPATIAQTTAAQRWIAAGCPSDALPDLDTSWAHKPPQDWNGLLAASFRVRLIQTIGTLAECRMLLTHLDHPEIALPAHLRLASGEMRLHHDLGFAALSGLSAAIATLLCCALWIVSGWADGGAAAALTAVFCCMFAAMDNPVPAILRFGGAILAGIPLAAVYLFGVLPMIDGFVPLALVLAPPMLLLGYFLTHPRYGLPALATIVGFCSALAIQENYNPDFGHFINSNIGQVVAVILAASVTAGLRSMGADVAIARLVRSLHGDLARLAAAAAAPDPGATLARAIDQLALLTQRLGAAGPGANAAATGLREVRLAMNIVAIQQLRERAERRPRVALSRLLQGVARYFTALTPGEPMRPDPRLLVHIDRALRLLLAAPAEPAPTAHPFGHPLAPDRPHGLAALVAFRRNLFPNAPAFTPLPAPEITP